MRADDRRDAGHVTERAAHKQLTAFLIMYKEETGDGGEVT